VVLLLVDQLEGHRQRVLAHATTLRSTQRATTGQGAYLDVSVAEGVLWLMSLAVDEQLALGGDIEPGHDVLSGRYACYATYQASDGRWLAVGALEARFFGNLCRALGCPELAGSQYEDDAQATIRAAFTRAFATQSRDEWVKILAGADTCVAPVLEVAEVADNPQFRARGVVVTATHPTRGTFAQLAPLMAGMVRAAAPMLPDMTVTDTEHLLKEAGVDGETVARWVERRVVA
jgi:alpha-methylacyl-CoA racemase